MPVPGGDYWSSRSTYHIDPHPQFSPDERFVIYAAIDKDHRPTVALTPVSGVFQ